MNGPSKTYDYEDGASVSCVCGDCLSILPDIDLSRIRLVLTDLPAGITRNAWDSPLPLDALWPVLYRSVPNTTPFVLFAAFPYDKILAGSNLRHLRYEWIWEKTRASGFLNAKRRPLVAHEHILVFCRRAPPYMPQMTEGHQRKTAMRKQGPKAHGSCYGSSTRTVIYDSTCRYPRSVLRFPSDKQRTALHPTQKPVALLAYLIRTYTKPGDAVLDFCMGSGATGVAARLQGRSFVGIELDRSYFGAAARRIATAGEDPLRKPAVR